jgi:hypothetical protein
LRTKATHRVGAELFVADAEFPDRIDTLGALNGSISFTIRYDEREEPILAEVGSTAVSLDWAKNPSTELIWLDSDLPLFSSRQSTATSGPQKKKKRKRSHCSSTLEPMVCPLELPRCELCRRANIWQQIIEELRELYPNLILRQFYQRKGSKENPLTADEKTALTYLTQQTTYGMFVFVVIRWTCPYSLFPFVSAATLSAAGVNALEHHLPIHSNSHVVDIGSGQGLAIMQVVFQTGCWGTGIEIRPDLTAAHENLWDVIVVMFPFMQGRVRCIEDDFQRQSFDSEYDVLISNNICFERVDFQSRKLQKIAKCVDFNASLAGMKRTQCPSSILVTTFPLLPRRNASDRSTDGGLYQMSLPGFQGMFSWQSTASKWYCYLPEEDSQSIRRAPKKICKESSCDVQEEKVEGR